MTPDQLFQIIRHPQVPDAVTLARCNKWIDALNAAMAEFEINTPARAAHFVAQLAHESGRFQYTHEIWGPTKAQAAYDSRADLGNTDPEAIEIARRHGSTPGKWFRGWGPIQTTGYKNLKRAGEILGLDLLNQPSLLDDPLNGCRAAGLFWRDNELNEAADTNNIDHVSDKVNRGHITLAVGDSNGFPEREELTKKALIAMGA